MDILLKKNWEKNICSQQNVEMCIMKKHMNLIITVVHMDRKRL